MYSYLIGILNSLLRIFPGDIVLQKRLSCYLNIRYFKYNFKFAQTKALLRKVSQNKKGFVVFLHDSRNANMLVAMHGVL